jgi:hypothetical protein
MQEPGGLATAARRFRAAGIIDSRAAASRTPCGRRCAAGLCPVLDPMLRGLRLMITCPYQ